MTADGLQSYCKLCYAQTSSGRRAKEPKEHRDKPLTSPCALYPDPWTRGPQAHPPVHTCSDGPRQRRHLTREAAKPRGSVQCEAIGEPIKRSADC